MKWVISSYILITLIFIGCAVKEIEYVPQIIEKEVYVPYIPELPEIECKFSGEQVTIMKQMLDCISLHKRILDSLKPESPLIHPKGGIDAFHNRK